MTNGTNCTNGTDMTNGTNCTNGTNSTNGTCNATIPICASDQQCCTKETYNDGTQTVEVYTCQQVGYVGVYRGIGTFLQLPSYDIQCLEVGKIASYYNQTKQQFEQSAD